MSKDQLAKFKEAAKSHGCDESEKSFDTKLGKLAKVKPAAKPKQKKKTAK